MRIAWIIDSNNPGWQITEQVCQSHLASTRLRVAIPSRTLSARGYGTCIFSPALSNESVRNFNGKDIDIAVFAKLSNPDEAAFRKRATLWLELAKVLKRAGVRIVADVCDNHFGDYRGDYLRTLCAMADVITVNTPTMDGIVQQHTGRRACVCSDPIEGAKMPPRFSPGARLRVLWFGHQSNLRSCAHALPEFLRLVEHFDIELHLVTAAHRGAEDICAQINRQLAPRASARFTAWDLNVMQPAFEQCDLVIVPSLPEHQAKIAQSANRLIESLWAGRIVVAHPIASYREFSSFSYLGTDLAHGVLQAIEHRDEILRRIELGQAYIERQYTPEKIADQWESALKQVCHPTTPSAAEPTGMGSGQAS